MTLECPKCQAKNPNDSKFCKECATPLPGIQEAVHTQTLETPMETLTTGSLFARRYKIIEELGKGGMGKVYRVYDTKLNEEIALKLIKADIAADKKTIERFKNELKLARRIGHKNVGRMYEFLEEGDTYFITMEYITGQDLKGLIRQTGQLTVGKAVSITKQICDGLSEAHSLGVVHRDLKPNNIMIDRGGNAKIMDFGIARAVKGKSITGSGIMIGTPQYMSPEQVEGKDVDLRSDIYSLGIILYEMLTERVPFEGDTPLTVGVKQKTEMPQDPKVFNARIPDTLSRVILKCLEKDREDRYANADELISELERIEQGIPITERIEPKTRSLTSREITVQLNVKKILIPASVIVVMIAFGLFFLFQEGSKNFANDVVVAEFFNQTEDPNVDRLGRLAAEQVSQALESLGLFGVAPFTRVDLGPKTNLEEKDFRQISKNADAALVITGQIYLQGTDLVIHSKLYDSKKQNLLPAPRPVSAKMYDFSIAIEDLSDRLKSAVLSTHDQRVETWQKISPYIPKYEALVEFQQGLELLFGDNTAQLAPEHFDLAMQIDPEYKLAVGFALMSRWNSGNFAETEKFFEKVAKFSDLSPGERYLKDSISAIREGDTDRLFLSMQKLEDLAPGTTVSYLFGTIALEANRPRIAIEALERLAQHDVYVYCNFCYWDSLTQAHHMLGLHKKELKLARKGRKQYPQEWWPLLNEVYALAALGRVDDVRRILDDNAARPVEEFGFPALLMFEAGEEFKAHGYDEAALEMFEESLSWLEQRSLKEELSDTMKWFFVWSHFYNQNWEEAETGFKDLLESNPDIAESIGGLGLVAAKRGNREEALRISERLKNWEKPFSGGEHTYWQASIAAHLGEKERAVSLLQTALQQGYGCRRLHCRLTLEPLWDFPAFVGLIKPLD